MLKHVDLARKANGRPILIPVEVTEEKRDQQVKLWTEMTDKNPFDSQLHTSHFRRFHGGTITLEIIEAILKELLQPQIQLDLIHQRGYAVS